MATPPARRRPAWLLPVLQFAAVATILYYAAPHDLDKGLAAGLIVFIIALIAAAILLWE